MTLTDLSRINDLSRIKQLLTEYQTLINELTLNGLDKTTELLLDMKVDDIKEVIQVIDQEMIECKGEV